MENNQKVRLMCSYGGKIQLRPHGNQLCYVGGDTKILTVDRNIKFSDMASKLNALCNCNNSELCIKYQLPGEDLDALVSVVDDDDVEQMMVEYDRMHNNKDNSTKPARLRLFLFVPIRSQEPPLNPDFLFGFDKDYNPNPILTPTEDLLQIHSNSDVDTSRNEGGGGGTVAVSQTPVSGARKCTGLVVQSLHAQDSRESHVNVGTFGNSMRMVYRVPVMAGGYHPTGYGQFSVRGVVSGGGGQYMDQPVYNFVPATTATSSVMVPDQKVADKLKG